MPVQSATIKLNKSNVYLLKNNTATLKLQNTSKKITWTSSNKNVATVNSSGKITAKKKGKTVINAKCNNKNYKCNVYVMGISRDKLEITKGETAGLSLDYNNKQTVTWKTSNSKIATVNNGKVKGVSAGTATITATCQGKSSTCKVYIPSLSLSKSSYNVGEKGKATVKNTICSKIAFVSSNPKVATVDASGNITAKGAGTANISSFGYNDGKCITTLTKTITVKAPTSTYTPQTIINPEKSKDYKGSMISVLSDMRAYIKSLNPNFNMITNGGYGLYHPDINQSADSRKKFFNAVDGVLIENVFYGFDSFNKATNSSDSKEMQTALINAKNNGKPIFNLEYCNTSNSSKVKTSSNAIGSVYYSAPALDLNTVPSMSSVNAVENKNNITKLSQVKNYLILLDDSKFSTKASYLNALKNTNYDMLFIDMYYDGTLLTKSDITSLKTKKNGAKRLVCTYISVGEAENYRYYWNNSWKPGNPSWLSKVNPEWEGNYKVKFWDAGWRSILYGNNNSYTKKALDLGFDGAYLDVIDAYEYFE